LQRNTLECFAIVTLEFEDETSKIKNKQFFTSSSLYPLNLVVSRRCFERRRRCLADRGWCFAGVEFGFCGEINELPDTPKDDHPLFEVETTILPKSVILSVIQVRVNFV